MLDREKYDRFRVAPLDPAELRCRDVERILKKLAAASGGRLSIEKFAESIEGRPIYLAKIGSGPKKILLWSQMHGDEPTHTAVLLDLANYLLQKPAELQAADILSKCTLYFIPMLNPDGAEAVKRYNAQGIDINRDARRLSTPEGRALRKAVETIKPEFGFNLHNQHARTSVGRPPKPAAVSVLAPAPDPSGHDTPSWHRAKLMCAHFVEAVQKDVPGMISRYDDTHEPRAFGDTIQATGASTMLVEAGGWTDPNIEPLTRVHFGGMLSTIHAIATDKYLDADIALYEKLPESNSGRQLDCMISNAQVLTAVTPTAFKADLGIEQSRTERLGGPSKSDGRVIEIGDLSTLSAKEHVDATGWLILAGQLAFLESWAPGAKLTNQQIDSLLEKGVTTVIGCVDLANRNAIDAIGSAAHLPMNWAYVGRIDKTSALPAAELVERVAAAANKGMLAIVTDRANEELWQQLDRVGLPLVQLAKLNDASVTGSYRDRSEQTAKLYALLNLPSRRGNVGRDGSADLAVFKLGEKIDESSPADWKRLARVIVAGETVWENGKRPDLAPGIFLRRS
ncbi:MAG TPA: M14 family zinc carboxypeptidase [Lacipirellulaceae bacterium]|nr:M14 family zinc carboxypeptidase [Lacipirellulaceae bacterium]